MLLKNRKGTNLMEVLTAAAIMTIIVAVFTTSGQKGITASFISTQRGQAAINRHNALERIAADIKSTFPQGATLVCDSNGENCNALEVRVPIVDNSPIAGTQYTTDGRVKYGADGRQDCYYRYSVNANRQLIRTTHCATPTGCEDLLCNGNGNCDPQFGETCGTCPSECGACTVTCGNSTCDSGVETCLNCPQDCGLCCPDGYCTVLYGETCTSCPADCGPCENQTLVTCNNDAACDSFENCLNCSDCAPCTVFCGDSMCNGSENCQSCSGDCGGCPPCDPLTSGTCDANETCVNCETDCGVCPPCDPLTSGTCDANETCVNCETDCGSC